MMSVQDYATDVNQTVAAILSLCKKLGIKASTKDDVLSEDDIIVLDTSIEDLDTEDNYKDEEIDDEQLEMDLRLEDEAQEESFVKIKKRTASKKDDQAKYKQAKKAMYKNKEKLETNATAEETDVILFREGLTVNDLAKELDVSGTELIKKLMDLGLMISLNQEIDFTTCEILAADYNKKLKREETRDIVNFEEYEIIDREEDLAPRPPVVTIMGHVDHGKTSLLDAIRATNVVEGEAGGITQHIGAYQVEINNRLITFIDTPGHEAFTAMRARGASITDIVVIIVSATDGVKPQTKEAIDHAKAAGVPIIVAINKMDLPDANPDRVLQELSEYSLTPEEWGGDTLVNRISCKTKEGIPELLENILLIADMQELKANPNRYATGSVIESRVDKNIGTICTLLIQNGTLRLGDPVVVGNYYGKVRTLKNDRHENIISANPSTPVEITGLNELPVAGDKFMAFETEKEAKRIATLRMERAHEKDSNRSGMSLDDLFSQVQEGNKNIAVVLKADVKGSEEAVKSSLAKINVEDVKVNVIRSGVGAISESDILLANASNAIIIGFNIRPNNKILDFAKEHNVDIRLHNIIYKVIEELEQAITGMLDPEYEEKVLGSAEIRKLFKYSKIGTIAGCFVLDGIIKVGTQARIVRDGVIIYDGKIASIQRGKDKVNEVKKGIECGITIENFSDLKEQDIIETYKMEVIKK